MIARKEPAYDRTRAASYVDVLSACSLLAIGITCCLSLQGFNLRLAGRTERRFEALQRSASVMESVPPAEWLLLSNKASSGWSYTTNLNTSSGTYSAQYRLEALEGSERYCPSLIELHLTVQWQESGRTQRFSISRLVSQYGRQ